MPGAAPILRRRCFREGIDALEHGERRTVIGHRRERGGESLPRLLPTAIAIGGKARGIARAQLDLMGVKAPLWPMIS